MFFSRVKIRPWFGALPLKLKPATEKTDSTSGTLRRICSASFMTFVVYSMDAPDGACTMVMKYPSSSAGTNAPGTARYTHHVAASDRTTFGAS